jgi:hypothetical protein
MRRDVAFMCTHLAPAARADLSRPDRKPRSTVERLKAQRLARSGRRCIRFGVFMLGGASPHYSEMRAAMIESSGPTAAFHSHVFLGEGHEKSERKTWTVIWLCWVMMIAEIAGA